MYACPFCFEALEKNNRVCSKCGKSLESFQGVLKQMDASIEGMAQGFIKSTDTSLKPVGDFLNQSGISGFFSALGHAAKLVLKKRSATTDNFDPEPVLERIHKKYGGNYRKGSLGEAATLAFRFQDRHFLVCPDISQSLVSIIGSDVVGISISCNIKNPNSFFIFKNDLTGPILKETNDVELKLGPQIYLLRFKGHDLRERLLKNSQFLNKLEKLSANMYFLNSRSNTLWYSGRNYREGVIEELNQIAEILDNTK